MKQEEYLYLLKTILGNDSLSDDLKIKYIQMLDRIKDLNTKELNSLEDKIYEIENYKLSDKEKIIYELNRLIKNGVDLELIKKLAYQNEICKSSKDRDKIKMEIAEVLLKNGEISSFYSIYGDLIKKASCKDNKVKVKKIR